jgi:exodeoxyribonuclease VIII
MNAPIDLSMIGLVHDQDIEAYHAGVGLSKSGLDLIAKAPALYYARRLDPKRPTERSRAGQLEGTLAHCAVLEPDQFMKRYAVVPADAPRRPTEAQWNAKKPSEDSVAAMAWWTEFSERTGGAQVVTSDQYDTAMRQAESIRRLPDIAEALAAGHAEVSAYWRDPVTGLLCKCRPDWAHPAGDSGVVIVDVKTYSDASPDEFRRQVARKRYEVQDAYYSDGYALASGREVLAFVFVAVETEWPFMASAVVIDDQAKNSGRIKYRRDVDSYARCIETGVWPGYSSGIETVSLPNWAIEE